MRPSAIKHVISFPFRIWLLIACLVGGYVLPASHASATASTPIQPVLGDYAGEIRETFPRKDGIHHIDTPRMIRQLTRLGVNTYLYLIWHESSDWDDLRFEFLPAAQKAGIDVWVYLVPPSEAKIKQPKPFATDYVSWFRAIAHLSRTFHNLKGIVMDDFNHNLNTFTPEYVLKMREAAFQENPKLRFYPQIYYSSIRPELIRRYRKGIDGVVMTYRDGKNRNTYRTASLEQQIKQVHGILSQEHLPFFLMIHAGRLSATPGSPSPRYVKEGLSIGLDQMNNGRIQGLITYVLPKTWFPEQKERTAYSGFGYGSLFLPPGNRLPPGGMGEIKQVIHPKSSREYSLTFSHFGVYPRLLLPGRYIKQLLIDGTVVWQKDVTAGKPQQWEREHISLTPYLKKKKEAVLTIRLLRLKNGSNSWLYTGFDHLESQGFQLKDPGFEQGKGWLYLSSHPSLIGNTHFFDPQRRLKTYLNTMLLYTANHFYLQTVVADPRLMTIARPAIQAQLQDTDHKTLRRLWKYVYEGINKSQKCPPEKKKALQDLYQKLDHLLTYTPEGI